MSESNADLKARVAELLAEKAENEEKLKEYAAKAASNGTGEIRFCRKPTMKVVSAKGAPKEWGIDEGKQCKVVLKIDGGYPRKAEHVKDIRLMIQHGASILKGLDALEKGGMEHSKGAEKFEVQHTERLS